MFEKKPKNKEEEKKQEKVEEKKVEQVLEDRSAFNCTGCRGEGLVGDPASSQSKVCGNCSGTGKV